MILKTLKLTNFKKYSSREFSFKEGLCGIVGKNGSGKSTIFEAILFAMYGELKNRGSKEIIKHANAEPKANVSVELNFLNAQNEYKILREFRGKAMSATAKLYKNDEMQVSGAKEVTNEVVHLTKMNKNAFLHTIFSSQKELSSLSSLKPEERKKMIRKLLGLEKIDFIQKELVEKSREIKRELNAFKEVLLSEQEIKEKKDQKKALEKENKEMKKAIELKEKDYQKLQKNQHEKRLLQEQMQKIKEQKQKVFSQIELLKNTIASYEKNMVKIKQELEELQKDQKSLKELQPLKKEYEDVKQKLQTLQELKEKQIKKEGLLKEQEELRQSYKRVKKQMKLLSDAVAKKERLEKELQQLQTQNIQIQKQIEQLLQTIKQIEGKISSEKGIINQTKEQLDKIQNLGKDSACPTCTRVLLNEYESVVESLTKTIQTSQTQKIQVYEKELETHEKTLAGLNEQKQAEEKKINELNSELNLIFSKEKDLKNLQDEFESIEKRGLQNKESLKALEAIKYDLTAHEKLLKDEKELKPKYERIQTLQTKLQRVPKLESEFQNYQKELEQKQKQMQKTQKEYDTVEYDEKAHQDIAQEIESLQQSLNALQEQKEQLKVQNAHFQGKIESIDANLQKNDKELEKLKQKELDVNDYEKIKVQLEAFKSKLNSKITPRIGSLASELFSQITHQKYQKVEVDSEFDFYIYDEGVKYPIDRFSGGEVDLANLVLRISISKTLSELSSVDLGFLAYDEVFGSQDENRRMQIMQAFHTIKERYRQIFLISHEDSIKQMLENVIEV